jgi:hypothetical protein
LAEFSWVLALLFFPLLLGAIDFGRAFYLNMEVENAARIAAQYGAQNSVTLLDTAGMINEVKAQAPDVGAVGACGGTTVICWAAGYPQAVFGWECSGTTTNHDGTTASGSCSAGQRAVDYVRVTTQANYTSWIPGVPSPLILKGQAKVRLGPP